METQMSGTKSKNIGLGKGHKKGDNEPTQKLGGKDADLTFSAESKRALETHPGAQAVARKLQLLTAEFSTEIQKLGNESGLDIRVRPIYHMLIKGS